MIILADGKQDVRYPIKLASTLFENGQILQPDGAGAWEPGDGSTALEDLKYVTMKEVTAVDADYAVTGATIIAQSIDSASIFEADCDGTLTTAMVGTHFNIDATGTLVDITGGAGTQVEIYKFISASKALIRFLI